MTTKAQLYLNEQTTEREFAEKLAAKDAEIAALRADRQDRNMTIALLWEALPHISRTLARIEEKLNNET